MSVVRRLPIKSKILLLVGIFAVGFLGLGLYSRSTVNAVKVNGAAYNEIIQGKNLVADIMPPPAFIIEAYLRAYELGSATPGDEFAQQLADYERIKRDYDASLAHWAQDLAEGPLKKELVETSMRHAREFFATVDGELLPALREAPRDQAKIDQLLRVKIAGEFQQHRAAIDNVVKMANEEAGTQEASIAALVSHRSTWLLAISGTTLLACVAFGLWLYRDAAREEAKVADGVAQLDAIGRTNATIEFKLDGTIVGANQLFLDAMGYTLTEIQGRHHSMFCEESFRTSPEYRELWAKLNRGEFIASDFKRIRKNGSEIWIRASYNPVLDAQGRPYKVLKTAVDVTAAKLAELDAARVSSMMEQAPINVMYADRELKVRYLNPMALKTLRTLEHLLPMRADQILGQSIDAFHKNPSHQRRLLSDPANLPYHAVFNLGPETLDLLASPVYDAKQQFIGVMATWSLVTKQIEMERQAKEQAEREQQQVQELSRVMSSVAGNATTLGASAEELTAVSTEMSANAEETAAQANVVSAASEQVSRNVQTVAAGVDEMGVSIREIAGNATAAAKVAQQAVVVAEQTNSTITKLGDSSNEIGKVIKVITSIAEQTNLLALNATIEAARAGEAGKGFAVVANEVKELAKETAKATEDIGHKIEAIQADTRGAVDAIGQISQIIGQINDISNTIASAVEEQTATTNEIARNVAEAARGSGEIAQNIGSVALAAQGTTQGASNTQQAASELSRMAAELQQIVSLYTSESESHGVSPAADSRGGKPSRRDGAVHYKA